MNWGEARKFFALACINALAFYFDNQWLYVAVGADMAVLGYELKNHIAKTSNREDSQVSSS